jgi:outer membrane protein OmpU
MYKKVLTSLMVAGVSLAALSAGADSAGSTGPSVKITGVYKAFAAGTVQKVRTNKGVQFMNQGNITFNAGGVANNGLNYGLMAILDLGRDRKEKDRFTEAYAYFGSDAIGNFQFGDTNGVSSLMMFDGTDAMGGTGGFDANLDKILNVTRGVDFGQNIGYVTDGSNRATKLTYMSPEVSGWQVGVSYTPDTAQKGRSRSTLGSSTDKPFAVNHLEGGLSFTNDSGPYTVGVYLVGALGKAKGPRGTNDQGTKLHPVKAWQFGTLIDYENIEFGAGYFNNGKSYMRRDTKYTNTHGFNLGISYGMGPVSLALGYTGTERTVTSGKAKADISSFTVDYSVADGLAFYGEASYFKFRAPDAHINLVAGYNANTDYLDAGSSSNKNNSGSAFVLGTRINF